MPETAMRRVTLRNTGAPLSSTPVCTGTVRVRFAQPQDGDSTSFLKYSPSSLVNSTTPALAAAKADSIRRPRRALSASLPPPKLRALRARKRAISGSEYSTEFPSGSLMVTGGGSLMIMIEPCERPDGWLASADAQKLLLVGGTGAGGVRERGRRRRSGRRAGSGPVSRRATM